MTEGTEHETSETNKSNLPYPNHQASYPDLLFSPSKTKKFAGQSILHSPLFFYM